MMLDLDNLGIDNQKHPNLALSWGCNDWEWGGGIEWSRGGLGWIRSGLWRVGLGWARGGDGSLHGFLVRFSLQACFKLW